MSIGKHVKKVNNTVVVHSQERRSSFEEVIMQYQNFAILLGVYLEISGKDDISLVNILEEHYENIYRMSQSLKDKSIYRKISKKIRKQHVQIKNRIKFLVPQQKALFFLYKVSIWDSLENVYLTEKMG